MVEEGKFGIRHRESAFKDDTSFAKPLWAAAIVALFSFALTVGSCRKNRSAPPPVPAADLSDGNQSGQNDRPIDPEGSKRALRWLKDASLRSPADRTLLERLAAAERMADRPLIATTIEKLRQRPSVADLEDALTRRLGDINAAVLAESAPGGLVASHTIRRGDSIARIAREYGTTQAAIRLLNRFGEGDGLPPPGMAIRTLKFPRALAVTHRRSGFTDLFINDRFFRRYYSAVPASAAKGPHPITQDAKPEEVFSALGIAFVPGDLAEISALMPPGSLLVLADP